MVASVNNADRSFAFSAVDAGRAILDKAFGKEQAPPSAPLTPVQQGEQARLVQANAPAQTALKEFQVQAQQLATREPAAFAKLLDQSFGTKLDAGTRAQLTEMAKAGNLPPPAQVRFVGDDVLGGALGAYSAANGGTIFLSESLKNDPASLKAVMAQEMGHHLDAVIGGPDTKGDEGRVFAAGLEKGGPLSASELANASAVNDKGTIMVDGKAVQVEFALPAVLIWLGQGAAQTVPDALIGTILQQLTGVPYTLLDKAIDFGLNLIPGAGQLDTAKKLAKIGEAIDKIIDTARLVDKLPKGSRTAAEGAMLRIQRNWGEFQDKLAKGDVNGAASAWGSMIGYLREVQIASKIADKGGTLLGYGSKVKLTDGRKVDIDVSWMENGKKFFGEVKSGNDVSVTRNAGDKFTKQLNKFLEKLEAAKQHGAELVVFSDNLSADLANELASRGVRVVENGNFLK